MECSNVPIQRFLNTMTREHKNRWKCQACRNKIPKTDNTNTPIRPQQLDLLVEGQEHQNDCQNITLRRKPCYLNESIDSADQLSLLGNTPERNQTATNESAQPESQTFILKELEKMLDNKFEQNKHTLLLELKATIFTEFSKNITELKMELTETTNILSHEQQNLKEKMINIQKIIENLDTENKSLKKQLNDLEKKLSKTSMEPTTAKGTTDYKVVIYGLHEYQFETEHELHDRIAYALQDILNIGLSGFIEGTTRLGKRGARRPVLVELLSKNMTKYILENRRYFKNTGLVVSEHLDDKDLQKRNTQRKALLKARQNGHHAVIRNNTLIIDGIQCEDQSEDLNACTEGPKTIDTTDGNYSFDRNRLNGLNRTRQKELTPESPTNSNFRNFRNNNKQPENYISERRKRLQQDTLIRANY